MGAPTYSYVAYIDESGDEGFKFRSVGQKGSSHWFVLSAAVTRAAKDFETVALVDRVRARINKSKALHFRLLDHEQRVPYVDEISKARLKSCSVLVDKRALTGNALRDATRLYFYAGRLLLERISWLCRDAPKIAGDGRVKIVLSKRSNMRFDGFAGYLRHLQSLPADRGVQIEWQAIDHGLIEVHQMEKRMGLQIADAVASSFYYAVETNVHGYIESRYAQMLKRAVYSRNGKYLSYGLKFMPPATSAQHSWLAEYGA